jgi:hypothetical protein
MQDATGSIGILSEMVVRIEIMAFSEIAPFH